MDEGLAEVGWDEDLLVATWAGLPAVDSDLSADACVVGLGASGLAAVEALSARGLSVIGLDDGRVGGGAAGRNGGFLLAGASTYLHATIEYWGAEVAVELYRETLAEIDRLDERYGPDVIRRTGSIRLAGLPGDPADAAEAADREAELADCAAHAAALRTYGFDVEDYDGPLGRGLFLPRDAAMNPVVRVLSAAAQARQSAQLFEHTHAIDIKPGEVHTHAGVIEAGVVIVAVDGGLDLVLPELGGMVRTSRLQMLATAPVERRLDCPVYGRWGFDYAQQDPSGRLLVGGGRDRFSSTEWTHEDSITEPVQGYVSRLAERMAGGPVDVTHRWGASAGFVEGGKALVTEVMHGVVACGGYSGTGNLVGSIAARAAVAKALDGVAPPAYFSG